MKIRQIISAAMCAAMFFSSVPFSGVDVFAQSSDTSESAEAAALKEAVAVVKNRISVPKEFDKFEYDSHTEYGTTFYEFTWRREKMGEDGNLRTDGKIIAEYYNGFISYYYNSSNENYSDKPSFPKLTSDEQERMAREHIYRLNPDLKGGLVLNRYSDKQNIGARSVSFSIDREENGIEFTSNGGDITIDRDTGALIEFELKWWSDAVIPDASKRLSIKQVSDIYASRKPLDIRYSLFTESEYDSKKKEYVYTDRIIPVYYPTVSGEELIDAITGNYTSYYKDREKYSYTSAYSWNESSENDFVDAGEGVDDYGSVDIDDFSDAEKAAFERENKYISNEKALKIIKENKYIVFDDKLVLSSSKLYGYTDEKGERQLCKYLEYEYTTDDKTKDSIYLSVRMDALSGRIIGFGKNYSYGEKSPSANKDIIDREEAAALAAEAAKYFMGERADEYRDTTQWKDETEYTSKRIYFTRYVNDIPTDFDDMQISVDSRGEVLGFEYTYHDMTFPEGRILTEKQAYDKLFIRMKPELYYHGFTDLQRKPHTYLTYRFDEDYLINALTGERINYYGTAYYSPRSTNDKTYSEPVLYTDIKGHKYEKEITVLWNYGVRLTDEEKLDPDGAITLEEFDRLLNMGLLTDGCFYEIYDEIYVTDPETGETEYLENPMLKKKLSYGELAKLYVYMYENECFGACEIGGIFMPPYKNISADNSYCGYIAVAKAKGLISDRDEFLWDKTITRAEALKIVYDYIASESESRSLKDIFPL